MEPRYVSLFRSGELERRAARLTGQLEDCNLCPHECHTDRTRAADGICGASDKATVSSAFPHFGEEPPLTGFRGSGTIFFAHCNLQCAFCQNFDISHYNSGHKAEPGEIAGLMIGLQQRGCHNINLVTPSHYVPQIMSALVLAAESGLRIPLVYNSSGYDSTDTLSMLNGVVDIYMPDFKFSSRESGKRYTTAKDYPDRVKAAIREMHRQVGDLKISVEGIATGGLLIRHLVMPGMLDQTVDILDFIAGEISVHSYVNLMDQYRPAYRAGEFPAINRRITSAEFQQALNCAAERGLTRGLSE